MYIMINFSASSASAASASVRFSSGCVGACGEKLKSSESDWRVCLSRVKYISAYCGKGKQNGSGPLCSSVLYTLSLERMCTKGRRMFSTLVVLYSANDYV